MSQNISIIEVGNYSEIFSAFIKFIEMKTLIITDIDTYFLVDDKDKKGNIRKNKDGSVKQKPELYKVSQDEHTSNSSLKFYLKDPPEVNSGTEKEIVWKANKRWRVLIVYQTNEVNNEGIAYNARSFEDAFFHINRKFF